MIKVISRIKPIEESTNEIYPTDFVCATFRRDKMTFTMTLNYFLGNVIR